MLRHGGGGALTRMMCGAVRFDHPAARNLVALLPDLICLDAGERVRTWPRCRGRWR